MPIIRIRDANGFLLPEEIILLNVYFGQMPEAIYNTAVYFKNAYQDKWITDDFSVEMIRDVDKSEVVSAKPCSW